MVFVEKWPCKNKREAEAREQHWIEILKPNMNKIIGYIHSTPNSHAREGYSQFLAEYLG